MAQRTAAGAANPNPNPHGWKSWRDIPDSMIPTTSKRDPDNPIYKTRKYVNYRKQQIWFQVCTTRLTYNAIYLNLNLINHFYHHESKLSFLATRFQTVCPSSWKVELLTKLFTTAYGRASHLYYSSTSITSVLWSSNPINWRRSDRLIVKIQSKRSYNS